MSPPVFNLSDNVLENAPTSFALELDDGSLDIEKLSLPALMHEFHLQRRPHWLLRKIMNALEQKRETMGLGWTRAWNRDEMNVFRIHVQIPQADADYFRLLGPLLAELLPMAPSPFQSFATELLADPALQCFTFYHNHDSLTGQFEGLTLSFGRTVGNEPGKWDRIDLIFEDRRSDGRVDGRIDRLKIYLCPWSLYRHEKMHYYSDQSGQALDILTPAQALYENCVRYYHLWKSDEQRQWSHWYARYIDTFGPRIFIPVGTSFS